MLAKRKDVVRFKPVIVLNRARIVVDVFTVCLAVSVYLEGSESTWRCVWPSVTALSVVVVSRSAVVGLLTGAVSGAVLLSGGSLLGH